MKKKTNEEFVKEVYDLVGSRYEFLEVYKGNHIKIKCKHNECGYTYKTTPANFLRGRRCPQCAINAKKTNKKFIQEVYDLVSDEYIFLEEYKDAETKILCRHNVCGYEWEINPSNFIRGKRCPNHAIRTEEDFLQKVESLVGVEYTFLEKYKGANKKIKCKHNKCGYEYYVLTSNFLRGRRCPQCAESKGERVIREYLQNNNIKFKQEYSFDDLVGTSGGLLRFDFAVFSNNNDLEFLIEYDGEFHYQDIYEDGRFELQQIHDKRKNQYCKDNNIPLLRIPYWKFDEIEEILERWIDKYIINHNYKT